MRSPVPNDPEHGSGRTSVTGVDLTAAPVEPTSFDDLTHALRVLRARAGSPSFAQLVMRVEAVRAARGVPASERRPGRVTVYDAFRTGRSRLDVELVADLVRALGGSERAVAGWRAAHAAVSTRPVGTCPAGPAPGFAVVPEEPELLVGRRPDVARLLAAWSEGHPAVAVVTGMPGVGKSALLRSAARAWLAGAPDDGPTGGRRTLLASTPADPEEAAELVATLDLTTPGSSLLLVDDVPDAAVVTAMVDALDGTGVPWALGVSSRRTLPDAPGRALHLDPLTEQQATALLAARVGADRLAAEPEATARIVAACGALPLALTVAGAQLRSLPGWSLADHAHRLEHSAHLLPVFDSSYRRLPADQARVLRRLALVDVPVPPTAAALLAGEDERAVSGSMAALEDEGLLQTSADGTVRLHDLIRRFAVEHGLTDEPYSARTEALDRVGGWLSSRAVGVAAVVVPHSGARDAGLPAAAASPGSVDAGRAWLERHSDLAVSVAQRAAELGSPGTAQDLSGAFASWLDMSGRWRAAVRLHTAAVRDGDPVAAARARRDLARAYERLGRYDDALAELVGAAESGHDTRPAQTMNRTGNVLKRLGRLDEAEAAYRRATAWAAGDRDPRVEGRAVSNRADVLRLLGRLDQAEREFCRGEALSAAAGDPNAVDVSRLNHALLRSAAGDLAGAAALCRAVLAHSSADDDLARGARIGLARLAHDSGDHHGAARLARELLDEPLDVVQSIDLRVMLGSALSAAGQDDDAVAELTAANDEAGRVPLPHAQLSACNCLGELALARGQRDVARLWFERACALLEQCDLPGERARAHAGRDAAART